MKQLLVRIVTWIHFRIFHRDISPAMREFLSHTAWSLVGIFFNAAVFFVLSIVAGRLLGPSGYGKYSLVIAITAAITALMTAGFDVTAVKYISQFTDPEEKNAALSNSLLFVFPFSLGVFLVLALFRQPLAAALHTDAQLIVLGLLFSLVFTYKTLLDGFVKALKQFPLQAGVKIVEALVALGFFIAFFFLLGHESYQFYLYAIGLGGISSILIYLVSVRGRIRRWNPAVFLKEKAYLKTFIAFSVVGIILNSIDKFFVAHFLGTAALGLYSVYLLSATVIVAQGILVINNVFFPMVNQVDDKHQLMRTLDRFLVAAFVPVILLAGAVSYAVVMLFGHAYGIHWWLILMVSLIAFAQIASSLYNSVLGSSTRLFGLSTRIYYLKPLFVMMLYSGVYFAGATSIGSVLGILLLSYLFDVANTKVTLRLIPA